MRWITFGLLFAACADAELDAQGGQTDATGPLEDDARDAAAPGGVDARADGAPTVGDGAPETAADARTSPVSDVGLAPEPDASTPACPESGPAYLHGDLWAFWFAFRTACDRQHKWWWVCEQRLPGQCDVERAWFEDCWGARGPFPPSDWDGSTPTPHSANWGVCQPHHWPEKNDPARRPGNPHPCDTTTFDYDVLRTADPYYGPAQE